MRYHFYLRLSRVKNIWVQCGWPGLQVHGPWHPIYGVNFTCKQIKHCTRSGPAMKNTCEVKGVKIAPNETSFTQFHQINFRSGCSFERDLEDYNLFMVFSGLQRIFFCEWKFQIVQMI